MRADPCGTPTEQKRARIGWTMASYANAQGLPKDQRCRSCRHWQGGLTDKAALCNELNAATHRHATCNTWSIDPF